MTVLEGFTELRKEFDNYIWFILAGALLAGVYYVTRDPAVVREPALLLAGIAIGKAKG